MEIRLSHTTGLPTLLSLPCKRLMVYKQILCNMLKEARNQDSRSEIQVCVCVGVGVGCVSVGWCGGCGGFGG